MHVAHLTLHDFRSYADIDVPLGPGVNAFIGRNGQGKTNLVEAIDYLARLSSHRVASEAPLVRAGADQALVRAAVVRDGRTAVLEVEINPGKSNRARINRSPLPRARELLGLVRTVIFSPEDLTLVKGDPSDRRRFLDDLLVLRAPRLAGVRSDYDRILKQRNSLLKTAGAARRGSSSQEGALSTLSVVGRAPGPGRRRAARRAAPPGRGAAARTSARRTRPWPVAPRATTPTSPTSRRWSSVTRRARPRSAQPWPGCCSPRSSAAATTSWTAASPWWGPHRDDLVLTLGTDQTRLPVKGYASHGEAWSFALALKLASYDLLRSDGDDPILILDDVFAELDGERRAPARGPRRRCGAGAGHRGGGRRRARGPGRHPVRRRRRGGTP